MTSTAPTINYRGPATPPPEDSRGVGRGTARLSFRALWALYVLTLRQHLHGKRWMVTAALFLLPAALGVFVRATGGDVPGVGMEFWLAFMFIPQGLLPIVGLLYASGMIQDEQEEQTITYLLIRPIPKWALYAMKWLATLTTTVTLTALFTALTYAVIYAGSSFSVSFVAGRCMKAAAIHAMAVIAYCSLFGLMSLLTKRTLIAGFMYAVIFEGLLANFPLSVRLITVIYYARIAAYRALGFTEVLSRFGHRDIAAQVWGIDVRNDPELAEYPQVRTCVMVLLGASVVFTALAAFLCSRKEFHVKTPEKT